MTDEHPLVKAFLKRMRELGYVYGRDLLLERRSAEGKWDRIPQLVTDLVRVKVDAIVVRDGVNTRTDITRLRRAKMSCYAALRAGTPFGGARLL